MPGWNNLSVIECENEVLRSRYDAIKVAAGELALAVEKYITPKKGDPYCSRSEVLRKKDALLSVLK